MVESLLIEATGADLQLREAAVYSLEELLLLREAAP